MRGLGISNLVATILLIAIAIALVVAIAAFVFGLLGNTARYGANWLYLYESLYNNYTLLERNYTLLLKQYNELESKYTSLLKELSSNETQCSLTIANISGGNYWGGGYSSYVVNQGSMGNANGGASSSNSNVMGHLVIYPNYFVYEVSNLTTYFVILTIHNGLNESVTISNITLSINGADPMNASIKLMNTYPSNSTDDVVITLFPGTDLGYVTSLSNYFAPMTIYFDETLPVNITSIGISIVYEYGNTSLIASYELDIGGNLNNT